MVLQHTHIAALLTIYIRYPHTCRASKQWGLFHLTFSVCH